MKVTGCWMIQELNGNLSYIGMLWINRRTMQFADGAIVSTGFHGLDSLLSDKSNRPTADYPNQRTVRDHLYAVSDGAPLCCVRDPCPPQGEPLCWHLQNTSRHQCLSTEWLPMFGAVKTCDMFVLLYSVFRSFHTVYCLLLTMAPQNADFALQGVVHLTPYGTG